MEDNETQALGIMVARLEGKVDAILSRHDEKIVRLERTDDDHETRIRGLERVRWYFAGVGAVLFAAGWFFAPVITGAPA